MSDNPYQPPQFQQPGPPHGYTPPQQQPQHPQHGYQPPPQFQQPLHQAPPQQFQQHPHPGFGQSMAPISAGGVSPDIAALFGSIDPNAVKETHEQVRDSGRFKWEQGENVVRVMPPRADSGLTQPWVIIYTHYIPIPGKKEKHTHVCPKQMAGLPCPSCENRARLEVSPRQIDQDLADALYPQSEIYGVVIDRKHQDRGPREAKIPKGLYDFLVQALGSTYAPINFADPFNGRDVLVVRQGEEMQTRYPVIRFFDHPTPLAATTEQMAIWARAMPNLNAKLVVPDYDSIQAGLARAIGAPMPTQVQVPPGYGQQQSWQLQAPPTQAPPTGNVMVGLTNYDPNGKQNF